MSEVDKHYGGESAGGNGKTGAGAGGAKSGGKLEEAASTAREGLRSAAETARAATDSARETYEKASDWGRGSYRSASRGVSEASRRSAAQLRQGKRGVEAFVEENPVMVGVVGLAAGLLLGALLPGTTRENRVFGRYADEVRDQGLRYARELAEQGKQYVEESLDGATRARSDRDTGDETRAA